MGEGARWGGRVREGRQAGGGGRLRPDSRSGSSWHRCCTCSPAPRGGITTQRAATSRSFSPQVAAGWSHVISSEEARGPPTTACAEK